MRRIGDRLAASLRREPRASVLGEPSIRAVSFESLHEPLREKRSITHVAASAIGSFFGRVKPVRGRDQCGQATKGMWGMSRRQEAMKGVEDCEKPGGMVKRVLIPGYPNERTLKP